MLHAIAAGTSRQAVVLTAILSFHFGLYLAVSQGPHIDIVPPPETKPIVKVLPPPPPPVERPKPIDPMEFQPGTVAEPTIPLPNFESVRDATTVSLRLDEESTSQAGAAPDVRIPPAIALDPRKLSTLINTCYPSASRRMGEEGTVLVAVVIGAGGRPVSWRVARSSGFPRLDAAVACVIGRLPFRAATLNGVAVQSEATLPISFRLN